MFKLDFTKSSVEKQHLGKKGKILENDLFIIKKKSCEDFILGTCREFAIILYPIIAKRKEKIKQVPLCRRRK